MTEHENSTFGTGGAIDLGGGELPMEYDPFADDPEPEETQPDTTPEPTEQPAAVTPPQAQPAAAPVPTVTNNITPTPKAAPPADKDKDGKNRKVVEVVIHQVHFAERKRDSADAGDAGVTPPQNFTELEDDDGEMPF